MDTLPSPPYGPSVGAAEALPPPAADATATAVATIEVLLPALITHLDALGRKYSTASGDPAKKTSFCGQLNKTKTVPKLMLRACEGREHTNIKSLNTALASKEAAMENLGFGPAFAVTQQRPKGSSAAAGGSGGGAPDVHKDVLVGMLDERFATIARHAAARAQKVNEVGRSRALRASRLRAGIR